MTERTPRLATFPDVPDLGERWVRTQGQRRRALPPHLIVEREQIIVKRQSDCAGQQVLAEDLVPIWSIEPWRDLLSLSC